MESLLVTKFDNPATNLLMVLMIGLFSRSCLFENMETIYCSIFRGFPLLYKLTQVFAAAAISFKMQALRNASRNSDLVTWIGQL
jgi:ABC-type arginine/histidine transport system permease subunit